jgi:hypothetical protein
MNSYGVHDKIDPKQLNQRQREVKAEKWTEKYDGRRREIDGRLEHHEFANRSKDRTT